ncbi:MAG TPA: CoB--CoM heterodisulfide reductase iron-sulfur subunit A family protein [Anaerolineales bacterium]|nr:CoB--CoM heterodisulfide reductase iron-sulfur subunit A family protein [Anaerolineae bacterium]HIQ02740.1 CoB--CoM heterodisulfide reductase iron-sulfur subunit A family protein [Anaerolineales bacterium]
MGEVLVIGGGIAGVQAALDLAEMGIRVHLVEKGPSIGGRMAQLDKTFPTNDCSTCILSPKMVDCARHPRIAIYTLSEVQAVAGEVGDFTVQVLKRARYVDETACTACGDCAQVCPVVRPDEFQMGLSTRRAIYIPFAQAVPQAYLRNREDCLGDEPIACGRCIEACRKQCIDFDMQDEVIELSVGSIVLAVGMETFDPVALTEYGYTRYENVITGLEFERLICASGPSGGRLIRLTDRQEPRTIGFVQCVGSRSLKYQRFCSSVCCMHATKEAILAREHIPDVQSYIFYTDLRASGKGFQEYIERARREYGVKYIRSRVARIEEDGDGRLVFHYEDAATSRPQQVKVDLAVLATSLIPGPDVAALAEVLGLELDEYGFFRTNPFSPTDTTREGVFTCGCCRGPADIPQSVAQASGAAARAAQYATGNT